MFICELKRRRKEKRKKKKEKEKVKIKGNVKKGLINLFFDLIWFDLKYKKEKNEVYILSHFSSYNELFFGS